MKESSSCFLKKLELWFNMETAENDKSFVEDNLHILKELSNLSLSNRRYIITKSGPSLILSFSEIFWNFIHNSNKDNLKDTKTIKLLKKNFSDIGILISHSSSIKKKREILISNSPIQKLALTVGLSGYEYYRNYQKISTDG